MSLGHPFKPLCLSLILGTLSWTGCGSRDASEKADDDQAQIGNEESPDPSRRDEIAALCREMVLERDWDVKPNTVDGCQESMTGLVDQLQSTCGEEQSQAFLESLQDCVSRHDSKEDYGECAKTETGPLMLECTMAGLREAMTETKEKTKAQATSKAE